MAQPYLGEIRLFGFGFAPSGWAKCDGQVLSVGQNQALFSLLGKTYGGDGRVTFGLPDLRGRTPMGAGEATGTRGSAGGRETVTLTTAEIPGHTHELRASSATTGGAPMPAGLFLGGANNVYAPPSAGGATTLHPDTLEPAGGSQSHENMQPSLAVGFCIALQGTYPSVEENGEAGAPDPYLGELRVFGGTFAPAGWLLCEGQLLAVSQHDALFSLLGTTYGGDGVTTFALPDLRGRLGIHQGAGHALGERSGEERVAVTDAAMPQHRHDLGARQDGGSQISPAGNVPASSYAVTPYLVDPPGVAMHAGAVGSVGGDQAHTNLAPALALGFIIAHQGTYPDGGG